MKQITFLVTYYSHQSLLGICIDSIKKFYPNSKIIVSQQTGDYDIEKDGFDLIKHDMKKGSWSDVAKQLLEHCETDIAVFMEHDVFLLKPLDCLIDKIESEEYDMIGPEEVCDLRNSPGIMMQNFFILNVKKMKSIGLENVRVKNVDDLKARGCRNIESGHGISESFDKKLFLPITNSGYAKGMYYGDVAHHLWFGSYRERDVLSDGINPRWMETESIDLIDDYWNQTFKTTGIKLPSSDNKGKYAVLIIAHKEKDMIGPAIKQWKGLVDKILVLVSTKSWNGNSTGDDGTISIANRLADEVILGQWKSEAEQRSAGLMRLYDYDYVITIDPDEFFTPEDRKKIIAALNRPIHLEYTPDFSNHRHVPAFKVSSILTYWKNAHTIFDPPDKHKPIIAVDPKQIYCYEHRQYKYPYAENALVDYVPEIVVVCHHFSWVKTDEKVSEKIASFSHASDIFDSWYENVWQNGRIGDNVNFHPYGKEQRTLKEYRCPEEIIKLFEIDKP